MTLPSGTRLGSFEISGALGAGGMGEVYRARDTKLGREVAIKVLPEGFAEDQDRLARFEREAKLLAALDHPNICAVYDLQEADGTQFIVMQLIEGETLADRIAQGPITLEEALPMFGQIAEALEAAHEQGIVHRDLKPQNIIVSEDGKVKVLDFGIAKPFQRTSSPTDPTRLSALDPGALTAEASAIGTPSYMSPEQARGKPVDKRTDIWAFGCTFYEALTGGRPFQGDTASDTLVKVLEHDPDWTALHGDTPPTIQAFLHRCLEKEPRRRLRDMGDIAISLEDAAESLKRDSLQPQDIHKKASSPAVPVWARAMGALAAFAVILMAGMWIGRSGEDRGRQSFESAESASPSAQPHIASLAVLPLENHSPQGDQDYFAESMTEAITAELAKIRALSIRGRTSAMQYKDTELEIPEVAEALKVDALIEGSVTRDGEDVRINVRLMHGATDTQLWTGSYTETITSVLKLQSDVALAIAGAINTEITGEEEQRIATLREVDPKAHEAYVLGQHFWYVRSRESSELSVQYFKDAVRIDPEFAEAWVGLGFAYIELGDYGYEEAEAAKPEARDAFQRAIAIDPNLGDAYAGLTEIAMSYDYDWAAAKSYGERALALAPNSARAHTRYGLYLMAVGEKEKLYSHALKALAIDGDDPHIVTLVAYEFAYCDRVEEAKAIMERLIESQPDNLDGYGVLAYRYLHLEREQEALSALRRYLTLYNEPPEASVDYAYMMATFHHAEQARTILGAALRSKSDRGIDATLVADTYVVLGELDLAFEWYERAIAEKPWPVIGFKVRPYLSKYLGDPRYQRLREDERFWEMADRIGFPLFPRDHPGHADEQRWIARKAAEDALAAQPKPVKRLTIPLPVAQRLSAPALALFANALALSPDGTRLVYAADIGGTRQLVLRWLDKFDGKPIPGTFDGRCPFFSPDGLSIGFIAEGALKTVSIKDGARGGALRTLCRAYDLNPSWGKDGFIYFTSLTDPAIYRVRATGKTPEPEPITTLKKGDEGEEDEIGHTDPSILPGKKALLFVSARRVELRDCKIEVLSIKTRERRVLVERAHSPRYVPTGHLVYAREGTLMARPFDVDDLEWTGPEVRLREHRIATRNAVPFQWTWSADEGTLVYVAAGGGVDRTLVWVDRKGIPTPVNIPPGPYNILSLSPKADRSVVSFDDLSDIWIYNLDRPQPTRLQLTSDSGFNVNPLWMPKSDRVVFTSWRQGKMGLYSKKTDATGSVECLLARPNSYATSCTHDEKLLALHELGEHRTGVNIWMLPLEDDAAAEPFLDTDDNEACAVFSPDGRWVAYASNETGQYEIYVRPLDPEEGTRQQISFEGGVFPLWVQETHELFYWSVDEDEDNVKIMAVAIKTEPTFEKTDDPKMLFKGQYRAPFQSTRPYDTVDGQRFLMMMDSEETDATSAPTELIIVENWFEELKDLAPLEGRP